MRQKHCGGHHRPALMGGPKSCRRCSPAAEHLVHSGQTADAQGAESYHKSLFDFTTFSNRKVQPHFCRFHRLLIPSLDPN